MCRSLCNHQRQGEFVAVAQHGHFFHERHHASAFAVDDFGEFAAVHVERQKPYRWFCEEREVPHVAERGGENIVATALGFAELLYFVEGAFRHGRHEFFGVGGCFGAYVRTESSELFAEVARFVRRLSLFLEFGHQTDYLIGRLLCYFRHCPCEHRHIECSVACYPGNAHEHPHQCGHRDTRRALAADSVEYAVTVCVDFL